MSFNALAWAVDQPAPSTHAYAVLVCMAGYACERGYCWPSMTTLAERTMQTKRSVVNQIAALENAGLVRKVTYQGRACYMLPVHQTVKEVHHHEHDEMYAEVKEVHRSVNDVHFHEQEAVKQVPHAVKEVHHTGERGSPPSKPVIEPVIEPKNNRRAKSVSRETPEKPLDVGDEVWRDFLRLRHDKRAALTQTALDGIRREALLAGWTLHDALQECCARGWQGFKAAWVAQSAALHGTSRGAPAKRSYGDDIIDAGRGAIESVRARRGHDAY